MNPLIKRLREHHSQNFTVLDDTNSNWTFSIDAIQADFYKEIYSQHLVWELEYRMLCQKINTQLKNANEQNSDQLKDDLASALVMAEILEHLYDFYLDVPREIARFRQDEEIYRQMLVSLGVSFPDQVKVVAHPHVSKKSPTLKVRESTANFNWYRLLFVRSIRLLNMIEFMSSHMGSFTNFMMGLNVAASRVLPYIAFAFFFPRILTNLGVIFKHTVPGSWMSHEEKQLAWTTRLWTSVKRRYFDLGNDLVWASVGAINCFLLVGMLAPCAVYVTVAFFSYDVLLAAFRAYIELSRLRQLQTDYESMLQEEGIDTETVNQITALQAEVARRMKFDKMRLGINVASTITIALAVACAIPIFLACPAIPLMGALWLVVICFITNGVNKVMNYHEPKSKIEARPAKDAAKPTDSAPGKPASPYGFFVRQNSKTNLLKKAGSEEEMVINRNWSTLATQGGQ